MEERGLGVADRAPGLPPGAGARGPPSQPRARASPSAARREIAAASLARCAGPRAAPPTPCRSCSWSALDTALVSLLILSSSTASALRVAASRLLLAVKPLRNSPMAAAALSRQPAPRPPLRHLAQRSARGLVSSCTRPPSWRARPAERLLPLSVPPLLRVARAGGRPWPRAPRRAQPPSS